MNDNLACEEFKRKISVLEEEINNLKRTVEDFQKKEDLYDKAEKICNYGHWSRDYNTNEGVWSKNVYNIFGVNPDEFVPSTENFLSLVHHSDRNRVAKSIHESISKCENLEIIYRIIRPDKSERFIRSIAEPIFVSKEKCSQLLGTVQDITERKLVEDALHTSEQKFSTVFHSNPAAIAITRLKDNRLVDINRAWEEKTGFSREEIVGHTTFELNIWVNQEDRQEFTRRLSRDGKFQNVEAQLKDKKGRILFMLMSGQLVNIEGEECLLTMAQDITEQKMLINRLKESEQRYRILIENSMDAVFLTAQDGRIITANKAACDMLGMSESEIIKTGRNGIVDANDPRLSIALKERSLTGKFRGELNFKKKNGVVFPVDVSSIVFKDSQGNERASVIARDLTDRVKAEKEKEHLQSELFQAQKLESLGTLVAGVAHEINNPINTIMNNAPLLQRVWRDIQPVLEEYEKIDSGRRYGGLTNEFLQDNMDQLISDIDQSANRVASIAKGLKDFSRKATSSEKLPVNLNEPIEKAVRLAGSSLHKSGIKLSLSLDPDLPAVPANPQNLEQIALNLIVNAVQAIDHDHGHMKIVTEYNEKTGTAVMSVEDNGRGIDPSVSDKIFDPFFTGRQKEGGTGLGLSITHNLVKINNGTISFNSQKDKGTVFSVSFPTRQVIEPARILLVDDEEAILKVMERALTRDKDYIIEKATNGHEALIKMGIFSPDLLMLDIFMPEMDGVEVIRAIKNQPELEDMKIIVISGHIGHEKLKQVTGMGVFKVLSKPIEMKKLLKEVEKALKKEER